MLLDTFVALMAGLIIFPACFAFDVDAGSGPGLVFVTLPNVFNSMPGGQLWGMLFFIFMSFAALTTVIAVLENIVPTASTCSNGPARRRSPSTSFWSSCSPCLRPRLQRAVRHPAFGPGSMILDLEDFIVSNNLLPLGSMVFLFFCCYKRGWGWDNFIAEADTGKGLMFPKGYACTSNMSCRSSCSSFSCRAISTSSSSSASGTLVSIWGRLRPSPFCIP